MIFQSPQFFIFLIPVLILYLAVGGHNRRIFILALANIIFYSFAGLKALIILVLACFITYFSGRLIYSKQWPKPILLISLSLLILNLAFFKYIYVYFGSFSQITSLNHYNIYIPLGISFYTFQMIAYLVDIYKGRLGACKSIINFWVFITFFGQLLSGPIMRGKDLIPQIEDNNLITKRSADIGILLILVGLFKKVVVADSIAIHADKLYLQAEKLSAILSVKAAWLFAFQIYYDFSAYTDIALGIGSLFGIKLITNFRGPYLSINPTEFWRRWHISLSSWVRDYIYIPLGGNKRGKVQTFIIIMITWSIMGLWHGSTLNFLVWGLYHGLLLISSKIIYDYISQFKNSRLIKIILAPLWIHLIVMGWTLFRVDELSTASNLFIKALTINPIQFDISVLILIILGMAFHYLEFQIREDSRIKDLWLKITPTPIKGFVYYVFILFIIYSIKEQPHAFIYFQF